MMLFKKLLKFLLGGALFKEGLELGPRLVVLSRSRFNLGSTKDWPFLKLLLVLIVSFVSQCHHYWCRSCFLDCIVRHNACRDWLFLSHCDWHILILTVLESFFTTMQSRRAMSLMHDKSTILPENF